MLKSFTFELCVDWLICDSNQQTFINEHNSWKKVFSTHYVGTWRLFISISNCMNYLIDMWLILNDLIQVDSLINYHIIGWFLPLDW